MEAPTYQQLIQMLNKVESEVGDDSGSLPTFQVIPVNGSNLLLMLNGPAILLTVSKNQSKSSYNRM